MYRWSNTGGQGQRAWQPFGRQQGTCGVSTGRAPRPQLPHVITPPAPPPPARAPGPCIDLFAPGVDVFSACGGPSRCETVSDSAYTYASGTSMAVPMVAGEPG